MLSEKFKKKLLLLLLLLTYCLIVHYVPGGTKGIDNAAPVDCICSCPLPGDDYFASLSSSYTDLLQVFTDLHTFLLPCGFNSWAFLVVSDVGFRIIGKQCVQSSLCSCSPLYTWYVYDTRLSSIM